MVERESAYKIVLYVYERTIDIYIDVRFLPKILHSFDLCMFSRNFQQVFEEKLYIEVLRKLIKTCILVIFGYFISKFLD